MPNAVKLSAAEVVLQPLHSVICTVYVSLVFITKLGSVALAMTVNNATAEHGLFQQSLIFKLLYFQFAGFNPAPISYL